MCDWLNCLVFVFLASLGGQSIAADQRVALVIGNANYSTGRLTNPPNDVVVMEAALKKLNFKVQTVLNANQNQMKRAVRDFGTSAQGAEVAFMYYSGHGTQAQGENYLLPVGASIEKESDYEVEAVSANAVLRQIQGAGPKAAILVLDACRDNPMAAITRSGTKGLSRMDAPTGTMIAFATAPNTTASDNGDYAKVLAKELQKPGQELIDVFRNTTAEVRRLSAGKQEPRISEMSISDRLYLAGQGTQLASVVVESTGRSTRGDPEEDAWQATKSANTVAAYDAFLGEFPKGRYAGAARISKTTLQGQSSMQQAHIASIYQHPSTPSTLTENAGPEWALSDNGSDVNWNEATEYCASKGSGWRLPASAELMSIYDPNVSTSCGQWVCHADGKYRLTGPVLWTNETSSSSRTYGIFFSAGEKNSYLSESRSNARALCLRRP